MRSKSQDIFEIEETYRDDEVLEYLKYNPSKSAEHLNEDIYYAVNQELVNE